MRQAPPPGGRQKEQEAHIPKVPIKQVHISWVLGLYIPTTSPYQNEEEEKPTPNKEKIQSLWPLTQN